jgi:hypothetical protein
MAIMALVRCYELLDMECCLKMAADNKCYVLYYTVYVTYRLIDTGVHLLAITVTISLKYCSHC